MRNIKLTLEYDGTEFHGSQLQRNGRSVQGELEAAVAKLTGLSAQQRCIIYFAGRTDSGVHAKGQVANFKTESTHSLEILRRGLNALLPPDLSVIQTEEASEEFNARFSAVGRVYRYRILNRPVRSPFERRYALYISSPLTVELMDEACKNLLGKHDFASFAGDGWGSPKDAENNPNSTVRSIFEAKCGAVEDDLIILELGANAFLPHMVRNIVGTLLLVGRKEISPDGFSKILEARSRNKAGPTAPACGLQLVKVLY